MSSIYLVNPKKRRKARRRPSKKRRAIRRRRRAVAAPRRARRRRKFRIAKSYRRNPIPSLSVSGVVSSVKEGAIAAGGALALDVAMGAIPLPDTMKSGPIGIGVKALGAIGLGLVAGRFLGRSTGAAVTQGALTVLAYNVLKGQLVKVAPNLMLGEYVNGMGEYVDGLGYLQPGLSLGAEPAGFGDVVNLPVLSPVPAGFNGDEDDGDDPYALN